MHVALLVATKDRLHYVKSFFESLKRQIYKNFSIIFVYEEQCAHDAALLVHDYETSFPITSVLRPQCGISRARNAGMPYLKGDLVAFPDDDCVYAPDTLLHVVDFFRNNPDVQGILGSRVHLGASFSPGHSRTGKVCSVYSAFKNSETFLQFYRASCIDRVGYFDEMLGAGSGYPYGSGEDTDYVLRACKAQCTVVRVPGIYVAHPDVNLNSDSLKEKTISYACGRMFLLKKHHFPFWFRLANVVYCLAIIPVDIIRAACSIIRFRMVMFCARMKFLR